MNREEKKQAERMAISVFREDARKRAGDLICDNCVYLGKIKDGRDAYYCQGKSEATVLVLDEDYSNYCSGLHISDLILNPNDDYCCTQAGRMAYGQGLFTLKIEGLNEHERKGK